MQVSDDESDAAKPSASSSKDGQNSTKVGPPRGKKKLAEKLKEAQEKSVSRGQATRLPTSCPTAHHTESTVSRYWCVAGVNSVRF